VRQWLDMRVLAQVLAQTRILGSAKHRPSPPPSRRRPAAAKSSAKNALRIAFAWAVTALVAISVYYGMLRLMGPR
jgi:hypothetical protein